MATVLLLQIRDTTSGNYQQILTSEVSAYDDMNDVSRVGQIYIFIVSGAVVDSNFKMAFGNGLKISKKCRQTHSFSMM